MLILTRRVGETLMVGDEVTVTVLGVKGNQVRIGVNAPKEVEVHREEIYTRVKKEREELNTVYLLDVTGIVSPDIHTSITIAAKSLREAAELFKKMHNVSGDLEFSTLWVPAMLNQSVPGEFSANVQHLTPAEAAIKDHLQTRIRCGDTLPFIVDMSDLFEVEQAA